MKSQVPSRVRIQIQTPDSGAFHLNNFPRHLQMMLPTVHGVLGSALSTHINYCPNHPLFYRRFLWFSPLVDVHSSRDGAFSVGVKVLTSRFRC